MDLDPSGYGYLTDDLDDPANDSEYVGEDSEFADNDDDDEDFAGSVLMTVLLLLLIIFI